MNRLANYTATAALWSVIFILCWPGLSDELYRRLSEWWLA